MPLELTDRVAGHMREIARAHGRGDMTAAIEAACTVATRARYAALAALLRTIPDGLAEGFALMLDRLAAELPPDSVPPEAPRPPPEPQRQGPRPVTPAFAFPLSAPLPPMAGVALPGPKPRVERAAPISTTRPKPS